MPSLRDPFTAAVIRQKISDKSWSHEVQIIEVPLENKVQIGHFSVEFITITHSIAEPNVLAISTPLGTIVHRRLETRPDSFNWKDNKFTTVKTDRG